MPGADCLRERKRILHTPHRARSLQPTRAAGKVCEVDRDAKVLLFELPQTNYTVATQHPQPLTTFLRFSAADLLLSAQSVIRIAVRVCEMAGSGAKRQ